MSNFTPICAGIDTAKSKLDVAVHNTTVCCTVANDVAGFTSLVVTLKQADVSRVGIEASGGYERPVIRHLRKAGFEVLLLQPTQVKAFAKLKLRRAKNDLIDASMIAACTAVLDPARAEEDARIQPLADALTFVEQIEEDIARAKTRLEKVAEARIARLLRDDIDRFKQRRTTELRRIVAALRKHADLAEKLDLIVSIPGIGERTALAILLRLPEIGSVSREQAAALAGLAPFDDDSGQRRGQRHIAGGRGRLRRSLYAAALPAAFFWNPALKALYKRLTERGKASKAALIACARKLLIYAITVVQRGTPWITDAQQT